jgi:hypothetical protein
MKHEVESADGAKIEFVIRVSGDYDFASIFGYEAVP